MFKRPHPLFALTVFALLFVAACTRFIGTLPSPAQPPTESPTSEAIPEAPTATLAATALPSEREHATVSDIVNIVEAKPSADVPFQPVQDGAQVGIGGQVRTGANSRARIDLSQGAIVRLGADTVFTVEAITVGDTVGLVSLDLGKLWASLTGGSLQVITPIGVASVRGSYAVFAYDPGNAGDPNDNTLTIDCIEGACSAQLPSGEQQAGALERIVVTGGGQEVTRAGLTGQDVQDFILENPEAEEALRAALAALPGASTAGPGAAAQTPAAAATRAPEPGASAGVLGQHTVQRGETLFCIGRAYGVLPGAIAEASDLDPNALLIPGQRLDIPREQWLNIPAGPVCAVQFQSPFPAGPSGPVFIPQITVLIPVTQAPASTATPAPGSAGSLAPTATATPVCQPPEFFDPFMNRCRTDP